MIGTIKNSRIFCKPQRTCTRHPLFQPGRGDLRNDDLSPVYHLGYYLSKRQIALRRDSPAPLLRKEYNHRIVSPLIRKGLLSPNRATHNSRAAKLRVTDAGMEIHRQVWACLAGFFTGVLRNIPAGRREMVLEGIARKRKK
jgi:hypothetical protein